MWDFLTGIPTQNFMRGALEKVFWGKYHVRCIPLAPARACLLFFTLSHFNVWVTQNFMKEIM
jgi:hypothetical protein